MSNYQIGKRPKFEENKDKLKLNKLNEKYNVIHPSQVSLAADLLLVQKTDDEKDTVIPVHLGYIMTAIPYFAKQYDENGIWREGKLKDQDEYYVSNLPETVSVTSAVAYIKNLYEDDFNPFSRENCLGILELADYWCDDFMRTECLNYIEEVIDDNLFMKIYKNIRIQSSVEKIVSDYVKRERGLDCSICENNRFHYLLPKESKLATLNKSNREVCSIGSESKCKWELFATKTISKNISNHEIQLNFKVTQKVFSNTYVGIVSEDVDSDDVASIWDLPIGSVFYGFRLNKFEKGTADEIINDGKNLRVTEVAYKGAGQLYPTKIEVFPIVNDSKPFDKFATSDVFTLVYSKTTLKLQNTRGFQASIELNRTPRFKCRFFVQIASNASNIGTGVELLPQLDHICE